MTDIRSDERDEDRRERRTRRHSTRKERHHESSDRDIIRGPDIEELRRARNDFYTSSGTSSRRTGKRVVKMPSASTSRVSLSSTKSGSRHRHKSRHKHSSGTDGSNRRRKSGSKERTKVSTEEYVYEVGGERVTETRTTYIEKEKGDEDVSADEEQTMSDIEEEPEADEKVRIIYVDKKKPTTSRPSSTRREVRDGTRSDFQDRGATSRKVLVKSELPVNIKRCVNFAYAKQPKVLTLVSQRLSSLHRKSSEGNLRRSHSLAPRPRPLSYAESNATVPNRRSSVFAGFFNPQSPPIKL